MYRPYLVEDLGETSDDGAAHVEARLEVPAQAVLQQLREARVALLPPRGLVPELGRYSHQRVVRVPSKKKKHAHTHTVCIIEMGGGRCGCAHACVAGTRAVRQRRAVSCVAGDAGTVTLLFTYTCGTVLLVVVVVVVYFTAVEQVRAVLPARESRLLLRGRRGLRHREDVLMSHTANQTDVPIHRKDRKWFCNYLRTAKGVGTNCNGRALYRWAQSKPKPYSGIFLTPRKFFLGHR